MGQIKPACVPGPKDCESINASIALLHTMHSISEQYYGVPWYQSLDRVLWREMNSPTRISRTDAGCLQWLHHASGGWWSWTNTEASGPSFLSTKIWDELH